MAEQETTYGVFVSGVAGPLDEFQDNLIDEGMSEAVAAEVIRSMPCFVKRDVPLPVAQTYKSVFERAGAWVMLENWQTTTNPAAHQGFMERRSDEPSLELATAAGAYRAVSRRDNLELDWAERDGEQVAEQSLPERERVEAAVRYPMTPRESRFHRSLPLMISVGLALLIGSYVYGCARVAQKQGNFNDELRDLNRVLENHNARGTTLTEAMIVEVVRELADDAGVSVDKSEIVVTADPIAVERHPYGGCIVEKWPDSVRYLPRFSYQRLLSLARSCDVPRWIIGVRVNTSVRWGLASQQLEFYRDTLNPPTSGVH